MIRSAWLVATLAAVVAVAAPSAAAQGNLSAQGFGYPPGQLSSRSLSVGGALAEFDPQSAVNPQAIGAWGPAGLYFQYDPEFRSVDAGSGSGHTTTSRFPVIAAALPVGSRFGFGVTASTFLDRTWETRSTARDTVFGTPVTVAERVRSEGAMNDVRVAGSFALVPSVRVGAGLHAITGGNRVRLTGVFTADEGAAGDTVRFVAFGQVRTLSYSGTALSVGAEWRPARAVALAASARRGGTIRSEAGDTLLGEARVPNRYGAGVRYDGIRGATFAARVNWEGWSSMAGLTPRGGLPVSDALEFGVGADAAGPRVGASTLALRLGVRWRDLPFGVRADPAQSLAEARDVRELAFAAGVGLPLASNRALVDVALQRASRSSLTRSDVDESAWTVSFGLRVRP